MLNLLDNYSGKDLIVVLVAYVLVLLISLSFHEFAHGYVAYKQGDSTPKAQGRLTLNPLAHIDIFGFLLILIAGFGWAKPVEVNPLKFRKYKKGMTLVALAGVCMNFILAFISYPFLFLIDGTSYFSLFFTTFFKYMVIINCVLIVFNLLPIYPLDGFRVIEANAKYDNKFVSFMRQYGAIILILTVIVLQYVDLLQRFMLLIIEPIGIFWNLIFRLF